MKRALLMVGAIVALSAASVVTSADVQVQLGDLFLADGRYVEAQDAYRRALGAVEPAVSARAGAGLSEDAASAAVIPGMPPSAASASPSVR